MIYVFEGIDGCGKSSAARELATKLNCPLLEFPVRTTRTGQAIDHRLKNGIADPLSFQCLHVVNKLEHLPQIMPALGSKVYNIVLSRWWQSALVYGQIDGFGPAWLQSINDIFRADYNILLDIDSKLASSRIQNREAQKGPVFVREHYEHEMKLEMARRLYLELWLGDHHPATGEWRVFSVSEHTTTKELDERVMDLVRE